MADSSPAFDDNEYSNEYSNDDDNEYSEHSTDATETDAVDSAGQDDYETWLSKLTSGVSLEDKEEEEPSVVETACDEYDYPVTYATTSEDAVHEDAFSTTAATTSNGDPGNSFSSSMSYTDYLCHYGSLSEMADVANAVDVVENNDAAHDETSATASATVAASTSTGDSSTASASSSSSSSSSNNNSNNGAGQYKNATLDTDVDALAEQDATTPPKRKSVRFDAIELIEMPITLGDNPSVSKGCPITVEWQHQRRQSCNLEVFEEVRSTMRRGVASPTARKLSSKKRLQLLLNSGVDQQEIAMAAKSASEIKQQRRESFQIYQMQQTAMMNLIWMANQADAKADASASEAE
uniref:Uncharacterized protein n=1 Tax=Craspedostauros australis TaxID=1486917 RepID=A0A7R9ZSV8_9STRA